VAQGAPSGRLKRFCTLEVMVSPSLTDALTEGRARTLALVEQLSDADVETQHTELMSPLVWDLAHIAAYEELWLVYRHAGEPLSRPELAAMYDAFETPTVPAFRIGRTPITNATFLTFVEGGGYERRPWWSDEA
jgi:DinB superfamily